jgi:hypothetical protein
MMKKALITVVSTVAALSAMAQGTLNFANGGAGVNAPVSDINGGALLSGAGFTAQLFAGTAGTAWDSLTGLTTSPFATGASSGYFFGGSAAVPGVAAGSSAAYQVRVWNSSAFGTWAAAWAAFQAGDPTAHVGVSGWNGVGLPTSTLASSNLGGGAVTPPNLTQLQAFGLQAVPEPSTIALGILGAAGLLLRRRK